MKQPIILYTAAIISLGTAFQARAEIMAGPVTNPANGHDYYLLAPQNWPAAEAQAENLGGSLAIIKNAAEQKWVYAQFGHDGDKDRTLWIGLHRQWQGGPLVWVDGSKVDYVNWDATEPDNAGGNENCVQLRGDNHIGGLWNDAAEATALCAVVEVPGKSDAKSLTTQEKSLIGTWYESGQADRPAWIAGTDRAIFLITHDRHAARLVFTREGLIYDADRQYGEIVKDKIVWSNGTWWSRTPFKYETTEKAVDRHAPKATSGALTD